ncbi:PIN domain-containing protein [Pseudomonas huaxiensis]|uniref:PIN domain-containing protein n=1 Tax=Pseudomonas huaxiensis TaxID=2213017 RepID=UPI001CDD11D8|nr:PIN domain-containing protein [Pseudomonas huaxiensis]
MTAIDDSFDKLTVEHSASQHFRQQIRDYVDTCQGTILPIEGELLTARIFELYFQPSPPFGIRQSKKSEFPDATSLLLLENYAKDQNTKGLLASADEGWSKFAESSDYLYCVKSIDELTALFAATGDHAKAIEQKITDSISNDTSPLKDKLHDAIINHIDNSEWGTSDITTGSVSRVEADVYDKTLKSYEIDSAEVWSAGDDKTTWVIELNISVVVDIQIEVEFFAWDSIDREEISLGSELFHSESNIEVEVFLTCSGVESESEPDDWEIEIEIAPGDYECEPESFEPDLS